MGYMRYPKLLLIIILLSSLLPLHAVSDGEYTLKTGFAFDMINDEELTIYEPSAAFEKTRFYENTNFGTALNISANFPLFYSVEGYYSDPFRLSISLDASFSFALRLGPMQYHVGPAFSIDAMLSSGNSIRVQYGIGIYQNLGLKFDLGPVAGIGLGLEAYTNIYACDFMDSDLSGFLIGGKFKLRPYVALSISYSDEFSFG